MSDDSRRNIIRRLRRTGFHSLAQQVIARQMDARKAASLADDRKRVRIALQPTSIDPKALIG
jgi:hypothetical protein